jgi:hypothetical protein
VDLRRRMWAGGDHAVGRKLYAYFLAAGIPAPQAALIQPLRIAGEEKTLAWSTLEASTAAIWLSGLPPKLKLQPRSRPSRTSPQIRRQLSADLAFSRSGRDGEAMGIVRTGRPLSQPGHGALPAGQARGGCAIGVRRAGANP